MNALFKGDELNALFNSKLNDYVKMWLRFSIQKQSNNCKILSSIVPNKQFLTHWMDKDNFLDNFRNHSILWISWNRKSRNNNMTSLWFVFKIVWQCLCTTPIIHRFEWKLFRQLHVIYWTGGAIKDLLDLIIQWMTSQIWLYYTYDIFGAFGNIWYIIILLS